MPAYTWTRKLDPGGTFDQDSAEWDEVWTVIGYTNTPGQPAWVDLVVDRPDLAPGQPHPNVNLAFVDQFLPARMGTSTGWDVTVKYKIEAAETSRDQLPWDRPAKISVVPESVEVPTFVKQDGTPWINTAGDLIGGITRNENHIVFNVSKNVAAVPTWSLTYADAVNNDAITVKGLAIAAHYALLKNLNIGEDEPEQVNGATVYYLPVSFQLVYNPRTWKTKVFNRGLYEIKDSKKVRIVDDEGEPVDEPQFLDSAGAALPYPVDPGDIVVIEGWNHELLAFSALPLT